MKRSLSLTLSSGALAVALAPAAFAQTDADSASTSSPPTANTMTCAELSTIDTATVPGVLYFVAGYSEGERNAGQNAESTSDADAQADSSDAAGSEESTATGEASTASAATEVEIGRVAGYFDIPVEEIVVACEADPDRTIVEILTEKGDAQRSGASTNNGEATSGESQEGTEESAGSSN